MLNGSTESLPVYFGDDWQAGRTLRFLVKKNIRILRGEEAALSFGSASGN
jgi:hypothetical protein